LKRIEWGEANPANPSPPARGRGLKLYTAEQAISGIESPPARGRGLKRAPAPAVPAPSPVAPRAGAWIETPAGRRRGLRRPCRPPRGGVD